MIRGRFLRPGSDISQALFVREAVFVREQGYSAALERDAIDDISWHALVYDRVDASGEPVGDACGTGRIWWQDGEFHLGRIAVLKEKRGAGMGDLVMRMLLFKAKEHGARSVVLSAQLQAAPFYARYGFAPYGELVDDEGVPHQRMRVMGDQINLEGTCCGHREQAQKQGDEGEF